MIILTIAKFHGYLLKDSTLSLFNNTNIIFPLVSQFDSKMPFVNFFLDTFMGPFFCRTPRTPPFWASDLQWFLSFTFYHAAKDLPRRKKSIYVALIWSCGLDSWPTVRFDLVVRS